MRVLGGQWERRVHRAEIGWCMAGRAAAAAGQSGLMALYEALFGMMDLQAAQVSDLSHPLTELA